MIADLAAPAATALLAQVARVRRLVEAHAGAGDDGGDTSVSRDAESETPLDRLCRDLHLSPFERDVLLLAVGAELDPALGVACAAAHGHPHHERPTFSLALAALPDAHWGAVTPAAPLRYWRLLELGPGPSLLASPLHPDERTLHHLMGVSFVDERLRSLVAPVSPPEILPVSYRPAIERVVAMWSDDGSRPVVELTGDAGATHRTVAAAACAALGLALHVMAGSALPAAAAERDALARLWEREAAFLQSALLIEVDEDDERGAVQAACAFAERLGGFVFLRGVRPVAGRTPATARLEVDRPAREEQRALWRSALGSLSDSLNGHLDDVVEHFSLDPDSIAATAARVRHAQPTPEQVPARLWRECRSRSRHALDALAQRVVPVATWADVVLPEQPLRTLHEIAPHVRHRARVYGEWGFGRRGARGRATTALFAGPSGVGKSLAAEAIAHELSDGFEFHVVDVSRLLSKWVGETEKNLRAVFDAAEDSGTILLFDEADGLFQKRGNGDRSDGASRWAAVEVSYLLQLMDSYRGLAILTTNLPGAIDPAFLRRLRFVVSFPFPDLAQRALIWQRVFPAETPTENLDVARLARLNVAGGNIRNIALNAAFLAAEAGEPVRMHHLLASARSECAKLDRTPAASEIGGWV